MYVELIEYPTAAKARAAIVRMHGNDNIHLLENLSGNIVRVTFLEEPTEENEDTLHEEHSGAFQEAPLEEPAEDEPAGDVVGEEADEEDEPAEPGSNQAEAEEVAGIASGDGDSDNDEEADVIDVNDYDRDGLRKLADELGLDLKIAQNTPLDSEREKVAAAINAAYDEEND